MLPRSCQSKRLSTTIGAGQLLEPIKLRRDAILALLLSISAAWAGEAPAPSLSIQLTGLVQHPQSFSLAQLQALPARHVEANFTTMHGQDHHGWTGALLWDVLVQAGLRDEAGKRTGMKHVLMIAGTDGYAAALAIGEIDPALEGKQVILAYQQDGAPTVLASLRLIVPGDAHGARDVHDVAFIEVR